MKTKKILTISSLALLLGSHYVSAKSPWVGLIPNGGVNSCNTCHSSSSFPDRNQFGDDFASNNKTWNAALAAMNSDGGSFTNGQELADPDGSFNPIPGAQVTNPGDASSEPVFQAPSISINSPINEEVFNEPFTGPITASTGDAVESITKIEFFSGASSLGTVTALPFSLPVNLSEGSYTLTVTATDYLGAAGDSEAVSITVNGAAVAPSITLQPASQTVTEGDNVTFTVAATGTDPLSYQWKKNTADIGGANNATLTLNNVTTSDAGDYTVVVTNTAGSETSDAATLTVNAAVVAPSITLQPASQTVTEGDNVTFTVAATGTDPLSYQWKKNTADIGGANNATLTLNNVTTSDAGDYTVVVSNTAGSETSATAVLTVDASTLDPLIGGTPVEGLEGWYLSEWFGYYSTALAPWLFHAEHGWIYRDTQSTNASTYFYDDVMIAWWWTNETDYPFLFAFDPVADNGGTDIGSEWLWYFEETQGPRLFVVLTGASAGTNLTFNP